MGKHKDFQTGIIAVLVIAVLFMTVGFAAYSSLLNINGTVKVSGNKWSVHFVPNSYVETTGSVEATDVSLDETTMTYKVNLDKIGDSYEFDIDVTNDGTLDAKLVQVAMGGLDSDQKKYIQHVVTYDGVSYEATTSNLNNLIAGDATKKVHVKVTYIQPEVPSDLPENDVNLTLTVALNYQQV